MKVYVITGNRGKFAEISSLLAGYGIEAVQLPLPTLEVQSESLREVVLAKAASVSGIASTPFIVEDSGLFIEALGGFPGPYSSYVFKKIGNEGILRLMRGVRDRRAEFRCVIAYSPSRGVIRVFEGRVRGCISEEARGSRGFGFDPIFVPEGHSRTLAEMTTEEKNRVSHRGRACRLLAEYLTARRRST